MNYCKRCKAEITEVDFTAGYCTQCKAALLDLDYNSDQKQLYDDYSEKRKSKWTIVN